MSLDSSNLNHKQLASLHRSQISESFVLKDYVIDAGSRSRIGRLSRPILLLFGTQTSQQRPVPGVALTVFSTQKKNPSGAVPDGFSSNELGLVIHAAHATHAAGTTSWCRFFLFRKFSYESFGRKQ